MAERGDEYSLVRFRGSTENRNCQGILAPVLLEQCLRIPASVEHS